MAKQILGIVLALVSMVLLFFGAYEYTHAMGTIIIDAILLIAGMVVAVPAILLVLLSASK